MAQLFPTLWGNPDYAAILTPRHHARLARLLQQAQSLGAQVLTIEPAPTQPRPETQSHLGEGISRQMAPTLVLGATPAMQLMQEEIFGPILPVLTYTRLDEAIAHINRYGSHHTDAILTTNHLHAQRFLREVDSASVMVNASTRFADGFEFGLGAEIGISTDKFHARGPVGLEGLTSLKYVVLGEGEVRV